MSQLKVSHMEPISQSKSASPWTGSISLYLPDITLITKTYGSAGRRLASIKSALSGLVPEQCRHDSLRSGWESSLPQAL